MPIDLSEAVGASSRHRKSAWLLFVCIVSALGGFLFGLDAIVISGAIGPVKSQFGLTSGEEGLFVSASLIGCAIGAAFASASADRFGRKPNLIFAGLVTLLGVTLCSLATTSTTLIISRLVGGCGVGVASMTCPLYIAETAPAHLRGRLVSFYQFAITLGILVALLCNAAIAAWLGQGAHAGNALTRLFNHDAWRIMFAVQIPAAILFVGLSLLIPESARWLLMRNATERARQVLMSFVSSGDADTLIRDFNAESTARTSGGLRQLFSRDYRRPAMIGIMLSVFSELSGITVIFYYGPLILEAAGADTQGALSGFAILGLVNMLATLAALAFLDIAGRRKLLLIGSSGCAVCMFGLASGLHYQSHMPGALIAAICLFIAFYAFSIGPVKFVIASEIFPRHLRGIGAAVGTSAVWVTGAAINQLFPLVRDGWGAGLVFYFCTAMLVIQFLFVWRFLPETAGKSLEEIEGFWALPPTGVSVVPRRKLRA